MAREWIITLLRWQISPASGCQSTVTRESNNDRG